MVSSRAARVLDVVGRARVRTAPLLLALLTSASAVAAQPTGAPEASPTSEGRREGRPADSSEGSSEGPSEATSDAKGEAERLLREGVELRREGREAEALERFRKANSVHPSARALGQMGLAAKSMRLHVEAERSLQGALEAEDDPWVQQNREALQLALDVVSRNLGSLVVTCNVPGAELLVNGIVVAKLPLEKPVRVPAGQFLVEVRAPGHTRAEKPASVAAGATQTISVAIQVVPPPSSVQKQEAREPLADAPASRRPWMFVAGGAGVVGLGLGTYLGVRTLSTKDERDEICPDEQCPTQEGKNLDDEARTLAAWSTVGFAVGVVGIGAAAVLWLTEPPAKRSARGARLLLAPARGGGVTGASFRF